MRTTLGVRGGGRNSRNRPRGGILGGIVGDVRRDVDAGDADTKIVHSVVDVVAVGFIDVGSPVNTGGKNHVGEGAPALLRRMGDEHGLSGSIDDVLGVVSIEHHHSGGVSN